MKAMLCKNYGPPESLVLDEIPSPPLTEGQVRVRVEACGINFPDTLIIEGKYQIKPPMPFAPGGEISGTIMEVSGGCGPLVPGMRVLAMTGFGGLAEEVVVPAEKVVPIPDALDSVTAAGFILTYGTSYHALKQRARLQPGETLLVLGAAGGVGLAAVELGKAMGAKVIAAASSPEKLRIAQEHGADELIDYNQESLKERVKKLTGDRGVDVVYDPVGGDLFDEVSRLVAWKGRLLVVGFAAGRIPQLPINLTLLKGYELVGVFWGAFTRKEPVLAAENHRELLEMVAAGRLRPTISRIFPLEETAEALNVLLRREAIGKVVVRVAEPPQKST